MRSRQHIIRRLVIPPIALALIVVPSYGWLRAGRVPGRYVDQCQALVYEDDAPPADLLLIGASRTRYGIDEQLVDQRLSERNHRTDKIVLLGNAESDANLALRTYLRERGAPETLGIEVLITRVAGDSSPGRFGASLTKRSYALFGADAYSGYLSALIDTDVLGPGDIYLRSHFPSPLKFFFEHLQVGFDNVLREPAKAIDPLGDCDQSTLPEWGPVGAAPFTNATPQLSERKIEDLKKEIKRYVPVNVDSRRASGEIAAMRDIVKIARNAGVKNVFLYYFPSFGETAETIDLDRVGELVPGTGMFDVRPIVNDPNKPGLNLQYKDRAHLSKYAAHEVTIAFVEFLKGLDR